MKCEFQTLCADQDQRQVGGVPVVGEAAEVVINRLEADLVLQTEDEDHGVHPQSKLREREFKIQLYLHTTVQQKHLFPAVCLLTEINPQKEPMSHRRQVGQNLETDFKENGAPSLMERHEERRRGEELKEKQVNYS